VTSLFDAFLCDFGIAKCMGNNRQTIVGGTAPYYAPELVTEMTSSDSLVKLFFV
jgi:serine/threonine protein kinase